VLPARSHHPDRLTPGFGLDDRQGARARAGARPSIHTQALRLSWRLATNRDGPISKDPPWPLPGAGPTGPQLRPRHGSPVPLAAPQGAQGEQPAVSGDRREGVAPTFLLPSRRARVNREHPATRICPSIDAPTRRTARGLIVWPAPHQRAWHRNRAPIAVKRSTRLNIVDPTPRLLGPGRTPVSIHLPHTSGYQDVCDRPDRYGHPAANAFR